MGKIYINGSLSPVSRPSQIRFDPVRGLIVSPEFHGPGLDSLAGIATSLINQRVGFTWKRGAVSTLQADYSGGQGGLADMPQTNWELLGNEIQKKITESAFALTGAQAFPTLLKDVAKGWAYIQDGDIESEAALSSAMDEGEYAYYNALIGFLERGQTHFSQGQYVVKRSISISNFYMGHIPGEDWVESLLSTSTLLSGPASTMPPVMSQAVSGIPVPASTHSGYVWGWRQLPSRMVTSAQNRVELSTEWWLEEWSTILYGGLI